MIFGTEYHVICIFVFMHKLDCGWSMQISWCLCYAHVRFSVSSATDLLLTDVSLIDSCLRACTVHVWQTHWSMVYAWTQVTIIVLLL